MDPKLNRKNPMPQVTVYSLPACVQCETTKLYLRKEFIEFTEVQLQNDPQAYEMIRERGFTQAPVVIAGENAWSGFRLDKLQLLKPVV